MSATLPPTTADVLTQTNHQESATHICRPHNQLHHDGDNCINNSHNPPTQPPQHEEHQYLNLIKHILRTGAHRPDRTGTGTVSVFGAQMRFSLADGRIPVLTTKRVAWRMVAEELLWFIRGSTDAGELQARNVPIWDGNSSREFLDANGFAERAVGDLGPVYGFQWRHCGAEYKTCKDSYAGQGIDQLQDCIRRIREQPHDRRILMCAWNPVDVPKMALPPCHCLVQFYVADGRLSCQLYQRSADMGLGVPFNIASYALLTHMIAHVTGLEAGEFVHTLGDAHVYRSHVAALEEQVRREPREFPTVRFVREVTDVDDFRMEDIVLEGYAPHAAIRMEMAV